MKEFIDIEGNLIKKSEITNISKIRISYPIMVAFNVYARYEFYVDYNKSRIYISESYRVGWFSNNAKNETERKNAANTIEVKRNQILTKLDLVD